MFVLKCDICKKDIERRDSVSVNFRNYEKAEFCEECALPILKFLKKNKFIEKIGILKPKVEKELIRLSKEYHSGKCGKIEFARSVKEARKILSKK
jgi:hypothetical protein